MSSGSGKLLVYSTRVLAVIFLLITLADYFSNVPTRVLVRSFWFFGLCFSVNFSAASLLVNRFRLALPLAGIQAFILPGTYIHYAGLRYTGGMDYSNDAVYVPLLLLMIGNGLLCGASLFVPFKPSSRR